MKRKLVEQLQNASEYIFQSAFANAHIKSMLQQEDGIGMLLQPAVELVGSTSAVFIRDLVLQAMMIQSPSHNTAATASSSELTLESLQQAIASNPQFRSLHGVLDNIKDEMNDATKSTSLLLSGLHTKKQRVAKAPVKKVGKPKEKASAKMVKGILQEVVDEHMVAAKKDATIVADEEDYD
jgi:hypothetical protein